MTTDPTSDAPPPDLTALAESLAALFRPWQAVVDALVEALRPVVAQIEETCHTLATVFAADYAKRGEPYGPGDEAMSAFYRDVAVALADWAEMGIHGALMREWASQTMGMAASDRCETHQSITTGVPLQTPQAAQGEDAQP